MGDHSTRVGLVSRRDRLRLGRGRILISLGLAAAIPVLLLSGWVAYFLAQQQRALARQAAVERVAQIAQGIALEIATQIQVLQTLAASISLDRSDLADFYTEAERLKVTHPLWETVELSDPTGTQVVNLLRSLDAELGPTPDRRSFEAVLRTHRPVVGGVGPVGAISGERLVALRVPVIRGETLRYVLSVRLATDAVSSILHEAGAPEGWVAAVVDSDGDIIARTRAEAGEDGHPASASLRAAIARAPQGLYTGHSLEGTEIEVVYRTLPETGGWSVHFAIPVATLDAPVARAYDFLAGGSLASVALAIGLSTLIARDMAQRRRGEQARMALALRRSEEQGAVAIEAAQLGTLRWDGAAGRIAGSERARRLLGLDGATAHHHLEWAVADVFGTVDPQDRVRVEDAFRACEEPGAVLDVEFRVAHPSEAPRWVRMTGRAADPLTEGSLDVIYGVVGDIEPRKRAEAERSDLLRRLVGAQEDERRRIARELHDQVGQTVTGLSLGLKNLEALLGGAGAPVREQVHWLQTLTGEIGRDIHRAAVDLRPTALDDLGLRAALQALLKQWVERHGVQADLQFLGSEARLPTEVEATIYRTVQEALTNVLKHAEARNVTVAVERRSDEVRVIIEDDGNGFDAEELGGVAFGFDTGGRPRLGLSGIRERLSLICGSLSVEASPGAGTALFVRVPIPPAV